MPFSLASKAILSERQTEQFLERCHAVFENCAAKLLCKLVAYSVQGAEEAEFLLERIS
jgi:hypothetical protein